MKRTSKPRRARCAAAQNSAYRYCAFKITLSPRYATVDFDPYAATIDRLIDPWHPLTFAFNSINRSMGLGDLYPLILGAPTMFKLAYIHDKVHGISPSTQQSENVALRAAVASLKRRITSPSLPANLAAIPIAKN